MGANRGTHVLGTEAGDGNLQRDGGGEGRNPLKLEVNVARVSGWLERQNF